MGAEAAGSTSTGVEQAAEVAGTAGGAPAVDHFASLWERIADAIPEAPAVVQGQVRRSWGELEARAALLAGALRASGLGEGSKVGLFLYNGPEYIEATFAAFKIRAVPVNVNYRYLDEELHYLLDNADAEAVVFHTSLGGRIAAVQERLPLVRLWLAVDDGPPEQGGTGEVGQPYEEVLAAAAPAPRIERSEHDLTLLYTGGTTGMPKGVMGEVGNGVRAGLAGLGPLIGMAAATSATAVEAAARLHAEGAQLGSVVPCPLMHGTGMGIGCTPALSLGGKVVLLEGRGFDPREVWSLVERERATGITVVGDVFARPMLRALEALEAEGATPDLSSLALIASAGAMFSTEVKDALCERIPTMVIADLMAASEGAMGQSIHHRGSTSTTGRFSVGAQTKVFDEDDREVAPGSGAVGRVAVAGGIPLGYYKDPDKTAATFREVQGTRYSFPGDWATVEADGTITLLGRGSQVVNTGGEKVFAEEVEEVVKTHEAVDDCLVVGLPDETFGNRVVAVVALSTPVEERDLIAHTKAHLASFKAPRQVVVVERVPRAPNGKADYKAAKAVAEGA